MSNKSGRREHSEPDPSKEKKGDSSSLPSARPPTASPSKEDVEDVSLRSMILRQGLTACLFSEGTVVKTPGTSFRSGSFPGDVPGSSKGDCCETRRDLDDCSGLPCDMTFSRPSGSAASSPLLFLESCDPCSSPGSLSPRKCRLCGGVARRSRSNKDICDDGALMLSLSWLVMI